MAAVRLVPRRRQFRLLRSPSLSLFMSAGGRMLSSLASGGLIRASALCIGSGNASPPARSPMVVYIRKHPSA